MELVYLWVEEYKNIKRQGFNFSPRFRCEFKAEYKKDKDGNEVLKDDCELIIEKNEDYVSIFPENINITAIVGENGSGKSSLMDIILTYYNNEKYLLIFEVENNYYYYNPSGIKPRFINDKLHLEYNYTNGFGNFYEFRSIFYSENIFIDNIRGGSYNIDYQTILNDYQTKEKLNIKITREIIKLLKSDCKYLPVSFSSIMYEKLFIQLEFDYCIKNGKNCRDIYDKISKYEKSIPDNNILYVIPFQEFTLELFEEIEERCKFSIRFKYTQHYDRTEDMFSQGQLSYLYLLSAIYLKIKDKREFLRNNVILHLDEPLRNNVILHLDEPLNALHPQWQKNFIYELSKFLEINFHEINFYIVINSHSPFILSDIPKENVIFLEKDKETGNCINATKKMKDFNTFGANINTLLSHGFFMKDGLMGEFAKSKIERIKRFYDFTTKYKDKIFSKEKVHLRIEKYYKLNKKEFDYIASIIGEQFLQKVMKNYLDELEEIFDKENYKQKKLKKLVEEFGEDTVRKFLKND